MGITNLFQPSRLQKEIGLFNTFMANKLRMLSKFLTLLLVAITFYSCEKNDEELSSHDRHQVKEYTFNEIIKQPKFNKAYNSFTSKLNRHKTVKNRNAPVNDTGFAIDSTTIKEITVGDITTYTMGIIRPQDTEGYFENLIVKVTETDSITAYITQYFPNKEAIYNTQHHSFSFDGIVKTKEIIFDSSIFETQDDDAVMCSSAWMCDYGGSIHSAGGNCTQTFLVTFCSGNSSGGSGGTGTGSTGGTGGVNTNTGGSPIYTSIVYMTEEEAMIKYNAFYNLLSSQQKQWLTANPDAAQEISNYLWLTNFAGSKKAFAKDAMNLAIEENNQADGKNLLKISLIVERGEYTTYSLDANFLNRIDAYVDLDLSNQDIHDPIITQLIIKYHVFKSVYPDWSKAKLIKETFKDLEHIVLDLFGLAPVIGEPADLISGVIYSLEGDHLNAALSYASAIPIAGWVGTGTKFGLKVSNTLPTVYSIATKIKLTWKVKDGIITFGQHSQLRKVLGMGSYTLDTRQAHHIIPWGKSAHPAIQKAAKSGNAFHMNEALNGIPLSSVVIHNGSHPHYDSLVQGYLDDIPANATPQQAYNSVVDLIDLIRTTIQNNPGISINQLDF
ncbi:AHH domain-containing protein [Flavobacterium sp.]|uniref:AHH domain-containing protein n=1 Tax=Flavobacterium sp. TaxID=239 RepID=UPI003D6B7C1D